MGVVLYSLAYDDDSDGAIWFCNKRVVGFCNNKALDNSKIVSVLIMA